MEEKKLTDEVVAENATTDEIIKAVRYLAETGEGRGWIDGYKCKVIKFADILDLIHRLQDEIERLTEKASYQRLELCKEIAELQKKVENQKAVIVGQAERLYQEKAENKRLYDEFVRLDDFCATKGCICCVCKNKKTCKECSKCESLKTEKCNNFKIDVSKYTRAIERADKLQKQVDELKEENGKLVTIGNGFALERNNLREELDELKKSGNGVLLTSLYKKQADDHKRGLSVQRAYWKKKLQQAEKDTAKEIYQEIDKSDILVVQTQEYGEIEVVSIERLKEIIKQKGVEVE